MIFYGMGMLALSDEIEIDFSKIKNLFKRKKETTKDEIKMSDSSGYKTNIDEDNVEYEESISQSNVDKASQTNKKEETHNKNGNEEKDEIDFNWRQIPAFFSSKKGQTFILILLILIPIFFSSYFRMMPTNIPITDKWASDSIERNIKNQIESQVRAETPNLPQGSLDKEVGKRYLSYYKDNEDEINKQIKATADYYRSEMQNDNGETYLLGLDEYFYYRYARNVIEHGYVGDKQIDGENFDDHMLAPHGKFIDPSFNSIFGAYLYKIFGGLMDRSLMGMFFLIPVIFASLSVIPAVFLGRKVGGNVGGFFAGMIIAVHYVYLARTMGGLSDTDVFTVFFPLTIVWLFYEAFDAKKKISKAGFMLASAFFSGIFAFAWSGWWYVVTLLICSNVIHLFVKLFMNYKINKKILNTDIKHHLYLLLIFIVIVLLFVGMFKGFGAFDLLWKGPTGFTKLKVVAETKIWPNVYTTVAELNKVNYDNVIEQIGFGVKNGVPYFILGMIGLLLSLFKGLLGKKEWFIIALCSIYYFIILRLGIQSFKFIVLLGLPYLLIGLYYLIFTKKQLNWEYSLLLAIWMFATIYASSKGIRFVMLAIPAFALAFSFFAGDIYIQLSSYVKKLGLNKFIASSVILVMLCLLLIVPISSGYNLAFTHAPSMTDGWVEALEYIRDNSNENAIINSWWDYGHWFKAFADRRVTFDGASQNTPQAHWIGKVLLTDNEDIAVGILKMLDCGGNDAFKELNSVVNDEVKSINILYEILGKDENKGRQVLTKYGLNDDQKNNVLKNMYCEPPEDFFIASSDMIGKAGVWAHFGSWDFKKASMYQAVKGKNKSEGNEILKSKYELNDESASKIYEEIQSNEADQWISPWPGYVGGGDWRGCEYQSSGNSTNNTIACGYNVIVEKGNGITIVLDGFTFDTNNLKDVKVYLQQYDASGRSAGTSVNIPERLIVARNDKYETYEILNSSYNIGVLLDMSKGNPRMMFVDKMLTGSLFTKLFFMEGYGLQHFENVKNTDTVLGERIKIFNVDWNGKSNEN